MCVGAVHLDERVADQQAAGMCTQLLCNLPAHPASIAASSHNHSTPSIRPQASAGKVVEEEGEWSGSDESDEEKAAMQAQVRCSCHPLCLLSFMGEGMVALLPLLAMLW